MAERYLTDICDIQYGFAFDSSCFTPIAEEGMPLVRIRDVMNGRTETYFKGDYPKEYIIHKGDFLVGMDGEFNIAPWQSEDALLNQRVCLIKSNQPGVSTTYLYWFLKKELKRIEDETPFVTVKHLSAKRLKQVKLEVPTFQEQERIVAELDCLSEVIAKKKQQLGDLDKLAQSIFYDMFGDDDYAKDSLISLCENNDDIKCGPFGTQLSKSEFVKEGVPVWGIPQINSAFSIPPADYVSQEKAVELRAFSVVGGDIVMSRKGNIGQSAIYPQSFMNGILHSDALRIRVKQEKANPAYLVFQFHFSPDIKHQFKSIGYGAVMPGLNVTKLKSVIVSVPPIDEQNEFAQKIESIEKQKALIKQSIAETETLFNSRMDYWFY